MQSNVLKIILIGDGRVGKTSMINKYVKNKFCDGEEMTITCSFLEKTITHANGERYKFTIWDTAGQEKYNALTPIFYRDAKGVLLVYDITNQNSFERLKKWVEEIRTFNGNSIIIIAGNKNDIKTSPNLLDKNTAWDYAKSVGAEHFFTSAKDGENWNEVFDCLTTKVIEEHIKNKGNCKGNGGWNRRKLRYWRIISIMSTMIKGVVGRLKSLWSRRVCRYWYNSFIFLWPVWMVILYDIKGLLRVVLL